MMRTPLLPLLCTSVILVGCAAQDDSNGIETLVDFDVIAQGNNSAIQVDVPTTYQLDTPASWESFWVEHHQTMQPAPPLPELDFANQMVIAIVDSDQPSSGYQLNVEAVQAVDNTLYISVNREQPGPGCVSLGMISQPYVMIQVPHTDQVPELRLNTVVYECE